MSKKAIAVWLVAILAVAAVATVSASILGGLGGQKDSKEHLDSAKQEGSKAGAHAQNAAKEAAQAGGEGASEAASKLKESAGDVKSKLSESVGDVKSKLAEGAGNVQSKIGEAANSLHNRAQAVEAKVGHWLIGDDTHWWHRFNTWLHEEGLHDVLMHSTLAVFWATLGAVAYVSTLKYLERRQFAKALRAPLQGPVILSKIYTVIGGEEKQRKFQDYWTNVASGFFAKQPGLRNFSLIRGTEMGNVCWCHMSEWNSIEDLRRAVAQPEICELKKHMPVTWSSKRCISQMVSAGKGGVGDIGALAGQVHGALKGANEPDAPAEGLRQRGLKGGPGQ